MKFSYSLEQLLHILRNYNEAVWPMQVLLFLVGMTGFFLAIGKSFAPGKPVSVILAFLWMWAGTTFYALQYSAIDTAGYALGMLFILQGLAFLYVGVFKESLTFEYRPDWYRFTGALLVLFVLLVYPAWADGAGHGYPKMSTFGTPATVIVYTIGILLLSTDPLHLALLAIPCLGAIIGCIVAWPLGIVEDVSLLCAGLAGAILVYVHNKAMQDEEQAVQIRISRSSVRVRSRAASYSTRPMVR